MALGIIKIRKKDWKDLAKNLWKHQLEQAHLIAEQKEVIETLQQEILDLNLELEEEVERNISFRLNQDHEKGRLTPDLKQRRK
jgi:hypothetical protein